jgi:hypothetical protein
MRAARRLHARRTMSSIHSSLFIALVLSVTFLAACGSSSSDNQVPVIDEVEAPATAKVGASGNYELVINVSCHDPDGFISKVRIDIPGFASPTINAGNKASFTKQPLGLQIDGHAAKGPISYELVVIDGEGGTASKKLDVTLE